MTAKSPVPTPAAHSYLNRLGLKDAERDKVIALATQLAIGAADSHTVLVCDVADAVEELGLAERRSV